MIYKLNKSLLIFMCSITQNYLTAFTFYKIGANLLKKIHYKVKE